MQEFFYYLLICILLTTLYIYSISNHTAIREATCLILIFLRRNFLYFQVEFICKIIEQLCPIYSPLCFNLCIIGIIDRNAIYLWISSSEFFCVWVESYISAKILIYLSNISKSALAFYLFCPINNSIIYVFKRLVASL